MGYLQRTRPQGREYPRISLEQLDGVRHLAIHPLGEYPHCAALLCQGKTLRGDGRQLDYGRRRPPARTVS